MRGTYRLKLLYRRFRAKYLLAKAKRSVQRFPTVKQARRHGLPSPLVVTLTSYPPRFGDLGKTLRSLLDQQVAADRVEVWIAHDDAKRLPPDIRALENHGLVIRHCRDIRSYKKLIPALEEDSGNFYVTADDDVHYPPDWLRNLVAASKRNPKTVIGSRTHMAHRRPDGSLAPYAEWQMATDRTVSVGTDQMLFPTGVGGILYPPDCFHKEVLDEGAFMELCPRGDDIWFFWMARSAGTAHRRTAGWFDIVEWPNTQDVALYNKNLLADGNDRQIRAMEARFGPVPDIQARNPKARSRA